MMHSGVARGRASFATARRRAIEAARRGLQRSAWPRLQMALIVALTGAAGLLGSFLMLRGGLDSMALRYPLAVLVAYGCFLLLVWLWLRSSAEDYGNFDVPLPNDGPASSHCEPTLHSGGGGDFGGGGASASFDAPPGAAEEAALPRGVDAIGSVAEGDEWVIPLAVVALVLGLALASCYLIYIAPVLLAEVLVDGAASYALYRHLKGEDPHHWLASAVRRSVLPFLATAVFASAAGAAMAWYAPDARSIGEVIRHAQ